MKKLSKKLGKTQDNGTVFFDDQENITKICCFKNLIQFFWHQLALSNFPRWKCLSCMSLHAFLTFIGLKRPCSFDFGWNTFMAHWNRDYFSRPWINYFILSIHFHFKLLEGPLFFAIWKCQGLDVNFDRVQYFHFPSWFVLVCGNLLGIASFRLTLFCDLASFFDLWEMPTQPRAQKWHI